MTVQTRKSCCYANNYITTSCWNKLRHNPGLSSVKQLQTKENQFNEIIITEYIYI